MRIKSFIVKALRKIYRETHKDPNRGYTTAFCQYVGQAGNDKIYEVLKNYQGGGLMLSKWGTVELNAAVFVYLRRLGFSKIKMFYYAITDRMSILDEERTHSLSNQAGVFPATTAIADKFGEQALADASHIDILASYQKKEKFIADVLGGGNSHRLRCFLCPMAMGKSLDKVA